MVALGESAYPSGPVRVVGFCYRSPLHLKRNAKAEPRKKRNRTREEPANFILDQEYKACAHVEYLSGERKGETEWIPIVVPPRFLTDLSSVPWYARCLIGQAGPHLEASIVHDWLYCAWQREDGAEPDEDMRNFADDVFRQAMIRSNVRAWRRFIMYWAVRGCGWGWFVGEDQLFVKDNKQMK